jgi:vancomycin resistance protein VanW
VQNPLSRQLQALARRALPHALRVEIARLRRLPRWTLERPLLAPQRLAPAERAPFIHVLAEHTSPLRRETGFFSAALQAGKERNIEIAATRLEGIVLRPAGTFSYHHAVGRPSRTRGFREGLELHDGRPSVGVGGGLCTVSNLLYLLALRAGLKVIERHRHALDLFPDHGRTVPFGCGATVFYNLADLRFENPLPVPVLLRMQVHEGMLHGAVLSERDPGYRIDVYEENHRFERVGTAWYRENWIRRRIRRADGTLVVDEEVAHNRGRVLYDLPAEEAM